MEHCDVLVVGGGPAGSSCAQRLSQAGLDVLVLDKSVFPRDKPCAGWITPAVLTLLSIDPMEYAQTRVFQSICGFCVGRLGGGEVRVRYHQPVSYGIRRCEFDHHLLQRSGARTRLGEPVHSIERENGFWRINGTIKAPLVVGAGGHFCPIARHLGATAGNIDRVVVAQEIEFEMNSRQARECSIEPDVPQLHFCEDLRGYGWCFRKGDHLNVGLGREDTYRLSDHVQSYVQFLIQSGRVPHDIPRRFRGHAYTLYGHAPREVVGDRMILVGDAAGTAYPLSGEGILTAIESGLFAADTILAAEGDYRDRRLAAYNARVIERFGAAEPNDGWLTHVPKRLQLAAAGWLFATPWFVRRIVLERWFLHARPG